MFATLAGGFPWQADAPVAEALAAVVAAQVDAGLGLLADGRVHAARSAPEALVAAWRATGDAAAAFAPGLPVKVAVTGPWSAGGVDDALGAAVGLRDGLAALAGAGCPLVEVHEHAATLPADDAGRARFTAAHVALLTGIDPALHVSLAITGGDAVGLGAEALFAAPYRSHLFDVLDGPDSWRLVAVAPGERGIVVGVGDATGRRRTRLEDVIWAASYAASTRGRGMERVGVAPCASLAGLPVDRAREVLAILGEAAVSVAGGRDDVLAHLDPRAIDARSAALGQYRPARRRVPGP
jgi:hypothetical protein